MSKHIWFVVRQRGKLGFPLDMLRYDSCYPATSEDATRIGMTLRREPCPWLLDEPHTIELTGPRSPTAGRWASFGWDVV